MPTRLTEKIDSIERLTLPRFPLVKSEYNNGNILYHCEKNCLLPLENNTFITEEAFKIDKNQIQVGHVNAFGPGHTEYSLVLPQGWKKDRKRDLQ